MKQPLLILIAFAAACLLVGCDRGPDRSTPEGTLAAARWAVSRGEAGRISDYIYADNADMRRLLRRTGVFLDNVQRLGTTILDISDPRKPRVVSQIHLDDPNSHSHKARVVGDIMIVNSEKNASALGRKSEVMATARNALEQQLGRKPTAKEIADKLSVSEADIAVLEESERNPYDQGGFRLYDVSDKNKPKFISFVKTGGRGVHRYDMDANFAYISTEMWLSRRNSCDLRYPKPG